MQKRSIETQKPTWGEMRGTAEIFTIEWVVALPGRSDEYPTEASNLGYSAFFCIFAATMTSPFPILTCYIDVTGSVNRSQTIKTK